jgi:hypothetical protein
MPKRLSLYFDTSIFNFAFADDAPDKKNITTKLMEEVRKAGMKYSYQTLF